MRLSGSDDVGIIAPPPIVNVAGTLPPVVASMVITIPPTVMRSPWFAEIPEDMYDDERRCPDCDEPLDEDDYCDTCQEGHAPKERDWDSI